MKPKVKTWLNQIESGMISTNTTRILNYIMHHSGHTIWDMRSNLNISHQTLTAIISNLMDEGLVKSSGEVEVDSSHYSKLFFVQNEVERKHQIDSRRSEKFSRLLLSINDYQDKLDDIQTHIDKLKFQDQNQSTNGTDDTTGNESVHQRHIQGTLF